MRSHPKRASLAALLTGTALILSCAAAGPAGAVTASASANAARPTWHVVFQLAGTDISSVTASGPDNAWAVGNVWDRKGVPHGRLMHWDGSRWRLMSYPDQRVFLIYATYALSATDVWFSANGNGNSELLHWSNGRWSTVSQLPVNAQNVDVISDRDIWLVGGLLPHCYDVSLDSQGCTVTSHWNGSTWTSYPLRAAEGVTFGASSASDVWAVGDSFVRLIRDSPSFVPDVFRWTGSAWQRTSLVGPRTFWHPSIVVRSPHNVYVAEASRADRKACAMHWNGSRWSPFRLPGLPGACKWTISDYHRGLWFHGAPAPGFSWVHWTGTRFVTTPVYRPNTTGYNTNGFTIAAVPHASLVWLFGSYCGISRTCRIKGVIAALR
jgi:hypothetical protein